VTGYVCPTCRARHAITPDRYRCDCGAPLALDFESAPLDRDALPRRPLGVWRYREALPLADELTPVTLGGGATPLVDDVVGTTPVHLALEYVSPTGSYKDRGASLLVSVAAALGAQVLVDDTSGNAGIALAAYAARAGLKARVLVPDDAPPAKPAIAAEMGAEVVRVAGGRAAAAAAALAEAAAGAFYASHAWSPFFVHGAKTFAYSLSEALRWTAPGAVVVPAGNGGLVLGLDLGYRELRRHGLIDRRPAIVAVQAAACAPLARAFAAGASVPAPVTEGATAADGVRVCAPPRGAEVLEAVRQSGGSIEAVSEEEIAEARRALWRKGYAVESTGAVAAAYILRHGDVLRRRYGDLAVALTGSGLKL
jgi:threonine synthase